MSAGHHDSFSSSASLRADLKHHLADPKVQEYLARHYTVIKRHPIPLTGGSSVDGKTYFLDPRLNQKYDVGGHKNIDLSKFVLTHERIEKALREVLKLSYAPAHRLATQAEHNEVTAAGIDWNDYKKVIGSIVRKDETETSRLPRNLDRAPYRDSGTRVKHLASQ